MFNSETNHYIDKATELIHVDLDICNILDKLQQIDKLKKILFDVNQIVLFNFHQKPKIALDDNDNKQERNEFSAMELQAVKKQLKD